MILAMQFDPSNMLVTLRNMIRQKLQLPASPVNILGQDYYMDSLTVELTTTLKIGAPDPANQRGVPTIGKNNQKLPTANLDAVILIDQPITARLYTLNDLINAKNNGTDPGPGLLRTFDLNLEMAVDISHASPAIVVSRKSVTYLGVESPELESQVQFAPVSTGVNLKALSKMLADVGLIDITRGGASLFLAGGVGLITVALELENPSEGPTPSAFWDWTAFNNPAIGVTSNFRGASAFGIAIDGRILTNILASGVFAGLQDKIQQNELELHTDPVGFWLSDRVVVAFSGAVVDACTFLFFTHDLKFDATVALIPQVPQPDTLRFDIAADFSANKFDDFVCSFSAATFPLNAVNLAQQGQPGAAAAISLGHFFGGFEGFVSIFSGTLFVIANYSPPADVQLQGAVVQTVNPTSHDSEVTFDLPMALPMLPSGTPVLQHISPNVLGPLLQGNFVPTPKETTTPTLAIEISPFQWAGESECSPVPVLSAQVDFWYDVGNYSFSAKILAAEIRPGDDDAGQFTPYLTVGDGAVRVNIPQKGVLPAYLNAPYDCRILVFTDTGVRLVSLGQFQQITQEQVNDIGIHTLGDPNCSGANSRLLVQGRWDVHWLIDPGPQSRPARLWNIFISNLPADNIITATTAANQLVGTAHASGQRANLSVLLPPAAAQGAPAAAPVANALSLIRTGQAPQIRAGQRMMRIMQTELYPLAQMLLPDGCIHFALGRLDGSTFALTVDVHGISVWDLSTPLWPHLRTQFLAPGLAGCLVSGRRIIAWGERGIVAFSLGDRDWQSRFTGPTQGPVLSLAPSRSGYLVAGHGSLIHLDPAFSVSTELQLAGARQIIVSGKQGIVLANQTVASVDLSGPVLRLIHQTSLAAQAIAAAPVLGSPGAFVARLSARDFGVFEFDSAGNLQRLASYTAEPWFAASSTLGRYILQFSPGRTVAMLYLSGRVRRFQA